MKITRQSGGAVHPSDFLVVALIEGVAEILPVGASAHAVLASHLLGWRIGSIGAVIHVATASALLVFLAPDVRLISYGVWRLSKRRLEPGTVLLGKVLLGCLPSVLATGAAASGLLPLTGDLRLVGTIMLTTALLMGVVDHMCLTIKRIEHMGVILSLAIGLSQLLAIVPGIGRSAAALTVARLGGLERPAAFRFVLLTTIPTQLVIAWRAFRLNRAQGIGLSGTDGLAFMLTFALVLLAATMATAWLRRGSLLPFAGYRAVVGVALIGLGG